MLTDKQIDSYLVSLEGELLKEGRRKRIELSRVWAKTFPSEPGVYVAFENNEIVYVGETGKIRGRMKDLLDTRNHTLRRNIGKLHFSNVEGYKKADSHHTFPAHIEIMVNKWLEEKILISAIPVTLGRKELETRIIKKFGSKPKYNLRGERQN